MRPLPWCVLLALLPAAGACAKHTGRGATDGTVAIVDTGRECQVGRTDLAAGKVSFRVTNRGSDVTEVYVYGHHDEIKGEVENIGPGTSRDFPLELAAGEYEVACKQGQRGTGVRTKITVTGAGGEASGEAAREIEFEAKEYDFDGLDDFTATAGDTVTFKMENEGKQQHEFELFGPDGKELGEIEEQEPGHEGKVTVRLAAAGTYRYVCNVDDHEDRGMKGTFTVR